MFPFLLHKVIDFNGYDSLFLYGDTVKGPLFFFL